MYDFLSWENGWQRLWLIKSRSSSRVYLLKSVISSSTLRVYLLSQWYLHLYSPPRLHPKLISPDRQFVRILALHHNALPFLEKHAFKQENSSLPSPSPPGAYILSRRPRMKHTRIYLCIIAYPFRKINQQSEICLDAFQAASAHV